MALDERTRLAIAQLVFFAPVFFLSIFVCIRHGFKRKGGWILITLLSAVRIAGAACEIAASQGTGDVVGLYIASATLSSIGLSFLISTALALVERINDGIPDGRRIPPRILRVVHLLILAGIIVGIVGGTEISSINDPSSVSSGKDKQKASVIIFLVVFLILGGAIGWTYTMIQHVIPAERRLLYAATLAYPFLLVRMAYSLAIAFSSTMSGTFSLFNPNVWAQAFMSVMEEFIVVIILLTAGLMTERQQNLVARDGQVQNPGEQYAMKDQAQFQHQGQQPIQTGRV